jgi:hypothetical protein
MHPARQRETHNAGVVNEDYDNGEGAQKIETSLPLAILKTWVDCDGDAVFSRRLMNARR